MKLQEKSNSQLDVERVDYCSCHKQIIEAASGALNENGMGDSDDYTTEKQTFLNLFVIVKARKQDRQTYSTVQETLIAQLQVEVSGDPSCVKFDPELKWYDISDEFVLSIEGHSVAE